MAVLGPRSKNALSRFADHDLVESVRVFHDRVRTAFTTGVVETWGLEGEKPRRLVFPRSDWWGPTPIQAPEYNAFRQFDDDYDVDADPFFVFSGRDIQRAGFLTQRLLIQSCVAQLVCAGWKKPVYPGEALDDDLRRLRRNGRRFIVTPGYVRGQPGRTTTPPPGMIACNQFVDWGPLCAPGRPSLAEAWRCPRRLYWAIDSLVRRGRDITRASIIHRMTTGSSAGAGFPHKAGPLWTDPTFYRAVLRDLLGLHRPVVLDLAPGCGAIGVATASLRGVHVSPPELSIAPEGMAWSRHIGGEVVDDEDDLTVDLALLGNLDDVEAFAEAVDTFGQRAAQVVAFMQGGGEASRLRVSGTQTIRFRERPYAKKKAGLIVVWSQR